MKKVLFVIILIVISFYNVYAKDISYSMNKYDDEFFDFIEKAYDKDLKSDGYILGGSVLSQVVENDDKMYNDYQVVLVKYDKNDKIVWKYTYGNTCEDYIDNLVYTYDSDGNIDGYLIVTKKTYDILSEKDSNTSVLLKIDFDGKLVWEKEINEVINKIIVSYDDNNIVDGYISINNSSFIKYDRDFSIIFKCDFDKKLNDLAMIHDDGKIIGYVVVDDNDLIKIDLEGNSVIINDISKYKTVNLASSNNGFIAYGITSEVKLKNGDNSYYLINYVDGEEVWETIGDTSTSLESNLVLLPIYKDNLIKEYLLLYKNAVDSSYEVIKVNLDGEVLKKVKKISNNYYNIKNFYSKGNTIYFIGQINCPEDDNCEYDNNSLYLVSDEDKVIEVSNNTSRNIIIVFTSLFVVLVGVLIVIRRKTSK